MFHPKFAWIDTKNSNRKSGQQKTFEFKYNDKGVFEYKDAGFNFTHNDQAVFIAWKDIEAIFVYKRDLMTVDEINMEIFLKTDFRIRLTEEIDGWYQFIIKLKQVFPEIDKEFDTKLIFPAFETNLTLVYNSTGKNQAELIDKYYDQYGR